MEAALVEMSASEPRGRLVVFVAEMVSGLPHVRQRDNALVYVRGLIEQGGRKSLQPTLFRLEESSARYESVQQFLADSPWDPRLLMRRCAERVAPEIDVVAWVVDDTEIAKQGKHSRGAHHAVSHKWLQGYLNEWTWRYNRREDGNRMFRDLIDAAAARAT